MSKLWDDLFGASAAKEWQGDHKSDAAIYGAMANNYGASMHKSIAALQNGTVLGHMNAVSQQALRPAPEPKDIPALAISLDAAYDLWAAKHGYDWVNINSTSSGNDINVLKQHAAQRYQMGLAASQILQPGTWVHAQVSNGFTVSVETAEPPEPEFDWYTVARRLVHVRALENEGGYYRLVPKEWCK